MRAILYDVFFETARAACTKAGIDYVRYERAEIPLLTATSSITQKTNSKRRILPVSLGKSI